MPIFSYKECFGCAAHFPASHNTCPSCYASKNTTKKLKPSATLGATVSNGATDSDAIVPGGAKSGGAKSGGS
jgi:hypothetical protein